MYLGEGTITDPVALKLIPSPIKVDKPEQLRPLKASEALRIGAAIRPQCFGQPFYDGASCAIGAIYEGLTGHYAKLNNWQPVYDYVASAIFPIEIRSIWFRNDTDRWSREQIADWLEGQGL